MHHRITAEALVSLLVVLVALAIPIVIGMALYKLFRLVRPLPPVELKYISDLDRLGDRFFLKSLIIGWVICAPIYYWLWESQQM